MAKNIVVLSDGTGQDGGARPEQRISNIYKMYRISRDHAETGIDPSQQVVFYDAGLGTDIGATALTAPVRFVQKLLGSVTGAGIKRNIADCYEFIVNHYEPGDRIFLFGFSRGAYTVRSVANLLMLCGVPTRHPTGQPIRFRKAAKAALGASGLRYFVIQSGLAAGVVAVAFAAGFLPAVGIALLCSWWLGAGFMLSGFLAQTIIIAGALGAFWYWQNKSTTKTIVDYPKPGESRSHKAEWKGANFDRLLSRHVAFARSANSIDETRKDFDRVGWGGGNEGAPVFPGHERLLQWWFAGNHSESAAPIWSPSPASPTSRWNGCAARRFPSPTVCSRARSSSTERRWKGLPTPVRH
ncbi:hypothetical protein GGD61_007953 [Bradyrhizobium sp. SBR1B]|nr:hypothetical protein [Bradyrhizobium sp. SBR1B]